MLFWLSTESRDERGETLPKIWVDEAVVWVKISHDLVWIGDRESVVREDVLVLDDEGEEEDKETDEEATRLRYARWSIRNGWTIVIMCFGWLFSW